MKTLIGHLGARNYKERSKRAIWAICSKFRAFGGCPTTPPGCATTPAQNSFVILVGRDHSKGARPLKGGARPLFQQAQKLVKTSNFFQIACGFFKVGLPNSFYDGAMDSMIGLCSFYHAKIIKR